MPHTGWQSRPKGTHTHTDTHSNRETCSSMRSMSVCRARSPFSQAFCLPLAACAKLLPFCCNCKVSLLQHVWQPSGRHSHWHLLPKGRKANCMQYCAFFSAQAAVSWAFTLLAFCLPFCAANLLANNASSSGNLST